MTLFCIATPLDREAPLGFPEHLMTAYNDVRCESVLNEYLPIYRALEESLAKRLFASRGISDDVIAATMHEFLKKDDDHEIGGLFRTGPSMLREVLEPPATIALPQIASDADATAVLLENLFRLLEVIKERCPISKMLTSNRANTILLIQFVDSLPEETLGELLTMFEKPSVIVQAEQTSQQGRGMSFNQFLALVDAYASNSAVSSVLLNWWNRIDSNASSPSPRFMLSWVRCGVLADRAPWFQGIILPDANEVFKYEFSRVLNQTSADEDDNTHEEGGAWSQTGRHIVAILASREEGLAALHRGLSSAFSNNGGWSISTVLAEFEGKGETGDVMGALYAFEKGISYVDKLKRSNDVVEVPALVVAELYADRSVCHLCMGAHEDSMSDASEALRLDGKNITALSVRARLLAQNAQNCIESGLGEEKHPYGANDGCGDSENDDDESGWLSQHPDVASALEVFFAKVNEGQAAEERPINKMIGMSVSSAIQFVAANDAMTAFLLGGSIDQTLGALAEDCARNACRNEAKEYFWNARVKAGKSASTSKLDSGTSFELDPLWEASFRRYLPRAWMVDTYLQAYEPLEVGLNLYSLSSTVTSTDSGIDEVSGLDRARSLQHSMYEDISKCEHREVCEILKFMHLIPESKAELGVYDVEAFRLLEGLVHALSSAFVEAHTPWTSLDAPSAEPVSCCTGLLEALRLLCVFSDACTLESISEEESNGSSQLENSFSVPLKIPIGVNLTVAIEPSGHNASDNPLVNEVCNDMSGVGVPKLTFRPNAELKERILLLKKNNSHKRKTEDSLDEEEIEEEEESTEEDLNQSTDDEFCNEISASILARLLSVIASIAHLCGDDVGAHRCLSASIALDGSIHDSRLKMACLLIELHQFDEAQDYFENGIPESPKGSFSSVVSDLHHAELFIHQFDYASSLEILEPLTRSSMTEYRFLNKLVETVSLEQERMCEAYVNHNGLYLAHLSPAIKGMIQTYLDRCAVDSNTAVRRRLQIHLNAISVNVQTMFGLVMLRVNPSDMKPIVNLLRDTLRSYPSSAALMNSIGEVLGQSGDATGALVEFQRSSELIWGNPMPYLNAARIYQQLGQSSACEEHLKEALKRDSTLVLAYVDGAQLCLQASVGNDRGSSALGRDRMALRVASTKQASAFVNAALLLSRHISEVVDVFATEAIARIYHGVYSGLQI